MVKAKTSKFPQISRVFPALIVAGIFFLILINIVVSLMQPEHLKTLLKDPNNIEALTRVLMKNQNPELDAFLKDYLQSLGEMRTVERVSANKRQQTRQIQKLQKLLLAYPQYPDGYAYLAVLYYRQRNCGEARANINQASELDPNRQNFQKIKQVIKNCQQ